MKKKLVSALLAVVMVLTLLPAVSVTAKADGLLNVVYVSGAVTTSGSGTTAATAVKTMAEAYSLVADGGTIVVCGNLDMAADTLPAKAVTITSKYGSEDYTSTAKWTLNGNGPSFQADVMLENISLGTATYGYGFAANGHKFTIGTGVTVTDTVDTSSPSRQIYIYGGCNGSVPDNSPSGADITVQSGSQWVIVGAGDPGTEALHNTGDINIEISGTAHVLALYAAYSGMNSTTNVSTFGNVNIDVKSGATVDEAYLGSESEFSLRTTQTDAGTITLDMESGAAFGSVYAGGVYYYHNNASDGKGQIQNLSNVVIDYRGATVSDGIYLGGAVVSYNPNSGIAAENSNSVTLNLYANAGTVFPPIKAKYGDESGYFNSDNSTITIANARINVIGESTFTYDPMTGTPYIGSVSPYAITNKIVRYTDSGTAAAPRAVPTDYVPDALEFASANTGAARNTSAADTNVVKFTSAQTFKSVSTDDTSSTLVLTGASVPVITASTSVSSTGGKLYLNFKKGDGTNWKPLVDTVVFQVPAQGTAEKQQSMLSRFAMIDMAGYTLAYKADESNPNLGQLVIAALPHTVTYNANSGIGTVPDSQSFVLNATVTTAAAGTFTRSGYVFSGWNTEADGTGSAYAAGGTFSMPANDVTLYAQWRKGSYSLDGTVSDSQANPSPIADAAVTLKQGLKTIAGPTATDNTGKYSFANLPAGTYDLIVEKSSNGTTQTVTTIVTITTENVTQNVTLAAKPIDSVLTLSGETGSGTVPNIVVGGLDNAANTEAAAAAEAQKVKVELTITREAEVTDSASQTDYAKEQAAIKAKAAGQTIDLYLDADLTKYVTTNTGTTSADIGSTNNQVLELLIPYNFSGKNSVKVWRYHTDTTNNPAIVTTSAFTELASRPAGNYVDGTCYFDRTNSMIYAYASKFSTYAVSYTIASSPSSAEADGYTLSFNTNGGSAVAAVTGTYGKTIDLTGYKPVRDGYTFGGWYADAALTNPVTSVTLGADTTVYAKWTAENIPAAFTDKHIAYIVGYEDGSVRPDADITRGEVAEILFRLLKDDVRADINRSLLSCSLCCRIFHGKISGRSVRPS